jgi:hypothetical protein
MVVMMDEMEDLGDDGEGGCEMGAFGDGEVV